MRTCIPAAALALGACATGSTLRSGVGDRLLEHPPFYASAPTVADSGRSGYFPVGYQRGAPPRRPGSIPRPVSGRPSLRSREQ